MKDRHIKTITVTEANELALILFTDNKVKKKNRVLTSEIWTAIKRREQNKVSINVSCRCFEGSFDLYKNGDIFLFNDNLELQAIENQFMILVWLLNKFHLQF